LESAVWGCGALLAKISCAYPMAVLVLSVDPPGSLLPFDDEGPATRNWEEEREEWREE